MFGSRLKTWMENYIGRPKKKVQAEAHKGKPKTNSAGGLILNSSESLAQSDTGISSGSQQVLSSSTTDYKEGYSTATMDSDRSALIQFHTAVSLPSPESAYSTGYSTDGTSPGATAPPEYYINIRTGKHYFPSPAPTPTSPNPDITFPNLLPPHQCPSTSFTSPRLPRPPPPPPDSPAHRTSRPESRLHTFSRLPPPAILPTSSLIDTVSTSPPTHLQSLTFSKLPPKKSSTRAQCTSLKLFLRTPRETSKPKTPHDDGKNKPFSPSKPKKWFKQPFHKFAHRRMDSCDHNAPTNDGGKRSHLDNPVPYLPAQDAAASPRQRNRIKTNPWLPMAPVSCHELHPTFPVPPLARNRSCTNTPLQNRKSNHLQSLLPPPSHLLNDVPTSCPTPNLPLDTTDRSDEDLTLNEMMGTYNESYVYEKETDILSDSDPTDCDDYDTDSDADNAGDERDSHDDELDFIDNASFTDSDDSFPLNTGRCTYHDVCPNKHSFLCNTDRRHSRKDADHRRSLRKAHDLRGRKEKRRQGGRRCSKYEDDDRKKQPEGRPRPRPQMDDHMGEVNLRRVLLQRAATKSSSRGAEGGAVIRRKGSGIEGSPRVAMVLVDEEADERYKELIEEAENMFESLRNSPVVKSKKKTHLLDGDGAECDKSVEIWKEAETMCCRQLEVKDAVTPPRKNAKSLALTLPVEATRKGRGLQLEAPKKTSFKANSSAHSPLDPLGPTLRKFSVFQPAIGCDKEIRTSSSDDSFGGKTNWKESGTPGSVLVPIAFQSVDLGKPLTSYCPQSEPVKRKVYSCSKTYDRLVKHLEHNPAIFEETQSGGLLHPHQPTTQPFLEPPTISYQTMPNM